MYVDLIRERAFENNINGIIRLGGVYFCDTMERAYGGLPKIPDGEYTCKRGYHRLKSGPIDTFEVLDVPGHTGILFHYGNGYKQSEGCILIGLVISDYELRHSREVFKSFMTELKDLDSFELIVHDI